MPELAEVARLVHHLRRTLTSQTISTLTYPAEDAIIFQTPKTGLTIASFADALKGKKVLEAQQQGKYFWLVMDSPPHPLMHLGMTGWMRFRGKTGAGVDYRVSRNKRVNRGAGEGAAASAAKDEEEDVGEDDGEDGAHAEQMEEWPPRYWRWGLTTTDGVEAAFVDGRRLGRVRLLDVPASELRNITPLAENGPDPVVDSDRLTVDFMKDLCAKRRKPIKSLLLDQGVISGIGNWMADEILYQAALHPEQYANTLDDEQVKQLHKELMSVCKTAVAALADSSQYPCTWIMKHRWDKGKKDGNVLPNGERIVHLTVGGRTSAIVPTRQKKTGPVAGDVKDGEANGEKAKGGKKGGKRKKNEAEHAEDDEESAVEAKVKPVAKKRATNSATAEKDRAKNLGDENDARTEDADTKLTTERGVKKGTKRAKVEADPEGGSATVDGANEPAANPGKKSKGSSTATIIKSENAPSKTTKPPKQAIKITKDKGAEAVKSEDQDQNQDQKVTTTSRRSSRRKSGQ